MISRATLLLFKFCYILVSMPHNLTITDKILAKVLLPAIPSWITPNIISWFRVISVPFIGYFLWNENYAIALPLFFVSAFSDAVDGSLARTRDLVTNFGKMFDPLADKLLIATAAVIIIPPHLGWDIVLAIVFIDFILITSAYFQKRYYGKTIQRKTASVSSRSSTASTPTSAAPKTCASTAATSVCRRRSSKSASRNCWRLPTCKPRPRPSRVNSRAA